MLFEGTFELFWWIKRHQSGYMDPNMSFRIICCVIYRTSSSLFNKRANFICLQAVLKNSFWKLKNRKKPNSDVAFLFTLSLAHSTLQQHLLCMKISWSLSSTAVMLLQFTNRPVFDRVGGNNMNLVDMRNVVPHWLSGINCPF